MMLRFRFEGGTLSALVLAAGLLSLSCSSQPELEFADWILPVTEATPVHEYAPVPLEERDADAVQLIEDLVIGGDPSDENTLFYQPTGMWASPAGDIFVVEMGNKRVQMFDAEGNYVRTIGKEGQGPGEFQFPFFVVEAPDGLGVYDMRNRRISVFSSDGAHLDDNLVRLPLFTNIVDSLGDGSFIALGSERDEQGNQTFQLNRYDIEGEELAELVGLPGEPAGIEERMEDPVGRLQAQINRSAYSRPQYAASAERVFVAPSAQYEVLAMTPAGEPLWALRVAWPAPPYPERLKSSRVESLRDDVPTISIDDFTWPEHYASIAALRSDGRGRLHVFPNVEETGDEPPEFRPVDVYSPEGELIASGLTERIWTFARGDYVYGYRGDAALDQTVIVRWRLVVGGQ